MAGRRKLEVVIAGDERGLTRSLGHAQNSLSRFGGGFSRFAGGMVTGMAAAFAIGPIVNFGSSLMNLGTQIAVAGIKTDTVFGESAERVREWADDVNESLGLSDEALTGLAANMGDLLKPMGFTASEAADMSTEMLGLAGALSAWSGGTRSSAEVAEILQSALLGEREQLKGLGISITEADVQARLAAKGQQELTGAALAQAEAIATQELLFEKSTDAQEAWANGSMAGVQAQNELKAAWEDAKVALAEKLLPVIQSAFRWMNDNVIPIVQHLIHVFDEEGLVGVLRSLGGMFQILWPTVIQPAMADLGRKLLEAGRALIEWVAPYIPPLLEKLGNLVSTAGQWLLDEGVPKFWEWLKEVWPPFAAEMGRLWGRVGEWLITDALPLINEKLIALGMAMYEWITRDVIPAIPGKLWEFAMAIGRWIADEAVPWLIVEAAKIGDSMLSWLADMPGRIGSAASGMWSGITEAFRGALNAIIGIWNGLEFTTPGFSAFGRDIGGFTIGTPDIPYLADGGIVRRPTLAMVGERGPEAVVPLGKMGGGVVVNVYGSVTTENDLVAAIRNGLIRDQNRRGIALGLT